MSELSPQTAGQTNPADLFSLRGQTVVLIGAGGLIGRSFARTLAAADASLVLADRDEQSLAACRDQLAAERVACVEVDIGNQDSLDGLVQAAVDFADQQGGELTAMVNCAYPRNANYGREFLEVEYDDFVENTGLHLGGYFLASQRFLKYFLKRKTGAIVNVASIYGTQAPRFDVYDGTPMTMPVEYAAIKAGLIQLTRYIARYVRGTQIRANCLSPGGVAAGQPESFLAAYRKHCNSRGMLETGDLDGALLFLVSEASRYLNGQNIIVDDGFTL